MSEHGEWSDELYARRVHRYEDHAVLAVPEKEVQTTPLNNETYPKLINF